MIIESRRDQTTCMLIVTSPETKAQKNQNARPFESGAGSEAGGGFIMVVAGRRKIVRRETSTAAPISKLPAAAIQIVTRTPNVGNSRKPAAMVPAIAPTKFKVYSLATRDLPELPAR